MDKQHHISRCRATWRAWAPLPLPSVLFVCCLTMIACGSRGSAPTTPSGSAYNGQWSGVTSQGKPIAFTVSSDEKVTAITVGYELDGGSGVRSYTNLDIDTVPNIVCIPGPCSPAISAYRQFTFVDSAGPGPSIEIHGSFLLTSAAQGIVNFRDCPTCLATLQVTWSASRR